jgi:two-component system NtrC family sensor kinase
MSKTENTHIKLVQHENEFSHLRQTLNFRRIWVVFVLITSGFAIVPVVFFALIDYNVTKYSVEHEAVLRTSRLASNTWRSVSFFLNQRKSAQVFTTLENSFKDLKDPEKLSRILKNLQKGFGDFTDIGVINDKGVQVAYEGPHDLKGKDYSGQEWFHNVLAEGIYISDVFLGFRDLPHLAIAIKHHLPDGSFYVLRATLEHQLNSMLSQEENADGRDIFLINTKGFLQTPSRYFGSVLDKISIPVPEFAAHTNAMEVRLSQADVLIVAYAHIPETRFILMAAQPKNMLMAPWRKSRKDLTLYLSISITFILIWIVIAVSYMVKRLKISDQKRLGYLHMLEYSNKLATIGRLAAGIAHEINNPLAIINEKAGLVKDLFTFKPEYKSDPKLIQIVDAITDSVARCSRITRRLLSFARHMDVSIQSINLKEVIREVLSFMEKEAEYRSIIVDIQVPDDIPEFDTDRGKLQQILLNIVNNAFAALSDGGRLELKAEILNNDSVRIICSDNGCGIPESDIDHIFEPFYSTKAKTGAGTGLGLSITYGLVKELGGEIDVSSKVNQGTSFAITLPLKFEGDTKAHPNLKKEGKPDESVAG